MSSVIKGANRQRGIHGVAFNLDDVSQYADKYLEQVRAQAAQLLAEAKQQAQVIRQQAEVEGRRAGQQAAAQTIAEQVAKQMQSALPALQEVATQLQQARHGWLAHWEQSSVRLAARMAERIVRRRLPELSEAPVVLVREALELAAGSGQIRVRLNPQDHTALAPQLAALAAELSSAAPAEFVADPSISRGGCKLETEFGSVDQQFEAQLDRLVTELCG